MAFSDPNGNGKNWLTDKGTHPQRNSKATVEPSVTVAAKCTICGEAFTATLKSGERLTCPNPDCPTNHREPLYLDKIKL